MISNYNENAVKSIVDFMSAKGLTNEGICGLLGNLYVESGLYPHNLQNSYNKTFGLIDEEYTAIVDRGEFTYVDEKGTRLYFQNDRGGYGLAQWTSSGRKQGLLDYAKSKNKSVGDLQTQIEWLYKELALSYKGVLNVLTDVNSTISDCARVVMTKFERPKNQSEENQLKRVGYAQDFFNKYFADNKKPNLNVPIIALSAGHFKYTSGKRCLKSIDPNETREWQLNSRIAEKVEKMLERYKVVIVRLDDATGEKLVDLPTRKMIAEKSHANIYIAIHHNAGVNGGSGGGTVVYHYPTATNKKQATELYNSIIKYTKLKGNRSQGVKETTSLYEVSAPTMDSYLIENGFMDSTTDVPIILTEEHANNTARGIVEYLVKLYGLNVSTEEEKPLETPSTENKSEDAPSKVDSAESHDEKYRGKFVTTANLNVRYGAGITKGKICTLPQGTSINCYGFYTRSLGTDWLLVQFNLNGVKYTGYSSKTYLKKV